MNVELLNFLEGLSPWWWVALAFVIGALEMLTGTFVLIWLALAALLMAFLLVVRPASSGEFQVVVFAALSVILTFSGRALLRRFGDGGEESSTLNQRAGHFVGRSGTVIKYANGEGTIEVEGMRWRARWQAGEDSATGDTVYITHADGMVLDVTRKRS